MKSNISLLRSTCRQAAALVIAREDHVLSLPDHIALKLHLLACRDCPKFEKQVSIMRAAMGRWRRYSSPAEQAADSAAPLSE